MAIQVEIWENQISGNLFKTNEFMTKSVDASQYVLQGKVVHIPQAGAKATVVANRSSLPATVVQRTDTDVTYTLTPYSSDPILIDNAESVELSYDKRSNVLMEHEMSLHEVLGDTMLISWAPSVAGQILRTSGYANNDGASVPLSDTAHLPSATGNRLKFGLYDLKRVGRLMDANNVPSGDRYALLDAVMYDQLVDDLVTSKFRDTSMSYDQTNGMLRKLLGFEIYKRSSALVFDNATTPVVKAYGAAAAADDNAAGLFWHMTGVERAVGPTVFFERAKDPQYYGDIYSFLVRMGGRKRRSDQVNVVAVVQSAAA